MIRKHSLVIAGHATSVSLEDPFWEALEALAAEESISLAELVRRIDLHRTQDRLSYNLSAMIRVYVLACLQRKLDH